MLTGPGDEAIGADQKRARAEALAGAARDVAEPITPPARERAKRLGGVKVHQQALASRESLADGRAVASSRSGALRPTSG